LQGKKKVFVEGYQDQKKKNHSVQITHDFLLLKRVIAWFLLDLPIVIHWRSIQSGGTLGQAVARPSRTCSTSKHPKRPDTDRNHPTIGKKHTHPVGCYPAHKEMKGG
jgi:hypothetical protein